MSSLTSPQVLRAVGAGWLIFFLLWLPFEDHHVVLPLMLAIDLCVWLALRLWSFWSTLSDVFLAALLAGAWLAAVPVFALGLMFFKGGLHGHGFPDFALQQFAMVLLAIPVCAALGAMLGAGTYLVTQKK
ncbi:MAG TPA: hypothetical protein PLC52_04750 [Anaerolineales bacterium]|nr:hypothetical protein [Anaerolineales bacterium]HRQ92158.1 hypothetical protein [Anaerolineales bacterium]